MTFDTNSLTTKLVFLLLVSVQRENNFRNKTFSPSFTARQSGENRGKSLHGRIRKQLSENPRGYEGKENMLKNYKEKNDVKSAFV